MTDNLGNSGLIILYAASDGCYSVPVAERWVLSVAHSDMLIFIREANRCIRILENISLRGGFWPGACAAAIRDLQQALQKKVKTDVSGARGESLSRRYEPPRPLNGLNQARPQLPRQNGHIPPPPNPSFQRSGVGSQTSRGYSQPRDPPNTANSAQESSLDLSTNRTSNSRTHPASPSQNALPFNYAWPGIDGGLLEVDNQFNGFDDIFQLIDVPFHLNEHNSQTAW